jgi:hypothetical protein
MPTAVRFLGGEPIYVDVVPLGINSNLTVVGVTGSHGYIQTATAVYTLFDCPGDNIWGTQLVAINDQGIMLGYWQDTNYAWHPFWTNGFGCTALPEVPGGLGRNQQPQSDCRRVHRDRWNVDARSP